MRRIGLVVHPNREIGRPLATLREWTEEQGIELVQVRAGNSTREEAPFGELESCDLAVAIGGDGTTLTALRAAAPTSTPVLGVACGSLGALSAVTADDLEDALGYVVSGSWWKRELPALEVDAGGTTVAWSINDFVLVRNVGQLLVDVTVEGELYARIAGDGVVAATAIGSSAYSMAAGGPVLASGTNGFVVTPLLMHGGCVPPVVVPAGLTLTLEAHPGHGGFDVEIDGHPEELEGTRFDLTLVEQKATLVAIGEPGLGLDALRRRGVVTDSPRVLARDERERAARAGS